MSVPLGKLDTPEQCQYVQERVARLMEQGHHMFETVHQRKDGSSVPTEVSARKITWDGQPATLNPGHNFNLNASFSGINTESVLPDFARRQVDCVRLPRRSQ